MKMNVKFLTVPFLIIFSINGAYGFEDTVQRYPTGLSDVWTTTLSRSVFPDQSAATVVNIPVSYPSSNSIRLVSYTYDAETYVLIENNELISSDYLAFTLRPTTTTSAGICGDFHIRYYNSVGSLVHTAHIDDDWDGSGSYALTYDNNDRFEIIRSGGTLSLYINGVFQKTMGNLMTDEVYIGIYNGYPDINAWGGKTMYIDDVSTSSIVGMNEEWTEAPTYIDTSYGVQSMFSFPTAVYTLETKLMSTGAVINTTILPSSQGSGDKPAGFVRWNRSNIFGTNWGLYTVSLQRDGTQLASTYFTYFDSTVSGSVTFDQDSYSQGQTANIGYTISSADFSTYTYYLKTMDVYGTEQDSYTLTTATGTKSPELTDYESGIYYAILSRTNKATGVNQEFAYDYASVTETVVINGDAYDALNGTLMHNVSIQFDQSGTYYNTTSGYNVSDNGNYSVEGLSTGISTAITANKTYVNDSVYNNSSYALETFSFTPLAADIYDIDLVLFPGNMTDYWDNTTLYGLVTDSIYNQPIEGATVNIFNDTWSNSTTTSSTGLYIFHNLTLNETYTVNATKTGWTDTENIDINVTANATRQDIPMSQLYTVTVMARDATSQAYLSDYTAYLDGSSQTAANGSVVFTNIEHGLHSISAVATGYYPSGTTPLIDEDTTVTLDLTLTPSEYYAPHKVKFIVKSLFGTVYPDVVTSVYIGATASGDTKYTGTTGTDGAVSFQLDQEVQYTLTFIKESSDIDIEITIYPIDDSYTVYVGLGTIIDDLLDPDDEDQEITAVETSITKTIIDDDNAHITVNYTDVMSETSNLTFTLMQSIAGDPDNRTTLSTYAFGAGNHSVSYNFTVTGYDGQSYLVLIESDHTTFGDIYRLFGVQFDDTSGLFGFAVKTIGFIGMIFIVWFALTSTSAAVPQTAVGLCAIATTFKMLSGWGYYISDGGLALAWIISIAAVFASSKEAPA
ncbi:MAG: carboxypeptidase regulatory-like domain-containing protein [Patescibacteria group bacterium]|jgi:hypothetical protein